MVKKSCWLEVLLLLPCAGQQATPAPGRITGTVKGDDGTALVGVSIALNIVRKVNPVQSKRPLPERDRHTGISGSGGSFSIDPLREGQYQLCAQLPAGPWLNTCDWGSKPLMVNVPPGQTIVAEITMRKGAFVVVRVDDPSSILALNHGRTPGAHLLVGVGGNESLFRPAVLVSQDAGGRNYQSLVPFDVPVKLVTSSSYFQLADAFGGPIQARTTATVLTARPGSALPVVRLIVTGRRSQ